MTALQQRRWRLNPREARLCFLLVLVVCIAAWKFWPRTWNPTVTLETPHYTVFSTATPAQTEATAEQLEMLFAAFSSNFGPFQVSARAGSRLKVKLYKNRDEFRRIHPGLGWAEAFYRHPYSQAYYSEDENNGYHWMLHEVTHQLNSELAQFHLAKWLEEGLAEYHSTSRVVKKRLALGTIDLNTYPVWWIDELATTPDLAANLQNGSVIPLRAIITNRGGPRMSTHFNLYYLHWWTLTHFIFEHPRYRPQAIALIRKGGNLQAFEQCIGPVDAIQTEWHAHVRQIKADLDNPPLPKIKRNHPSTNTAAIPKV